MPWRSDLSLCVELLRANGIAPLRSPPPLPSQSLRGKKRASNSQAGGSGASQRDQKRARVEAIKSEDSAFKVERADDDANFSAADDVSSLEVCVLRVLHSPHSEQCTGAIGSFTKAHCGREGCSESRYDRQAGNLSHPCTFLLKL